MQFTKYYEILGITDVKNITEEQVKKVYKKLSILCHPDKITNNNNLPEALIRIDPRNRFIELNNAYTEIISEIQNKNSQQYTYELSISNTICSEELINFDYSPKLIFIDNISCLICRCQQYIIVPKFIAGLEIQCNSCSCLYLLTC